MRDRNLNPEALIIFEYHLLYISTKKCYVTKYVKCNQSTFSKNSVFELQNEKRTYVAIKSKNMKHM